MRGSLRIGRLAGIPIGIHPLWLVIVGLITWSLGHDYFPDATHGLSSTAAYALGLAAALGLFAGILLHELGHAVVARRHGIEVDEIDLWLLGGVARLRGEARVPRDELRFAAAGPAVTAVIAAVLGVVRLALGGAMADWLRALVDYEVYVNCAILVLNLLPAFPLDGGRLLRSLLWLRWRDQGRATAAAARAGRGFGWALVVLGGLAFFSGAATGLWFALIGWFLIVASGAEMQASRVAHAFGGRTVGELMSSPAACLPERLSVAEAIDLAFSHHLYSSFPVVDAEQRPVGLLTLGDVRAVAPGDRATATVGDVCQRDPELVVGEHVPVPELLARPAFQRVGRAAVVRADGTVCGLISVTDLDRRLRAQQLLGAPVPAPSPARRPEWVTR